MAEIAPFHFKQYAVSVVGFPDTMIAASSPGKARVKAWQSYRACAPECSYRDFLRKSSLRRSDRDLPKDFGKRITIGGAPAYLIKAERHSINFIWPGGAQVLYSHPLDADLNPEIPTGAAASEASEREKEEAA